MGDDGIADSRGFSEWLFQSTSPVWETTTKNGTDVTAGDIFQSTSPVWETTMHHYHYAILEVFQSTSPVWETTSPKIFLLAPSPNISIHVSRVGDDIILHNLFILLSHISIHVSRVGDDFNRGKSVNVQSLFQSTSPVWETTHGYITV